MTEMSNEELFALRDSWYSEAAKQTVETLPAFMEMLAEFQHDYNTAPYAITAAALGASWAMDKTPHCGITGFQAGCIMWEYIQNWNICLKDKPLSLVNYESMLYPQYGYKFTTINTRTWKWIQEQAYEKYNAADWAVCDEVKEHWKSIIDGKVPFGYTVRD
jgi:hypothetical protein